MVNDPTSSIDEVLPGGPGGADSTQLEGDPVESDPMESDLGGELVEAGGYADAESADDGESDAESDGSPILRKRVEDIVRPIVEAEGFKLYELDPPHRSGGVLRVYIWKGSPSAALPSVALSSAVLPSDAEPSENGDSQMQAQERQGVILDECARVSKALEAVTALDDAIEGAYILEVSSPGVNRKLSRLEHFAGAIGEFAKVVTNGDEVLCGPIVEVKDGVVAIDHQGDPENSTRKKGTKRKVGKANAVQDVRRFTIADVRRARIDFQF